MKNKKYYDYLKEPPHGEVLIITDENGEEIAHIKINKSCRYLDTRLITEKNCKYIKETVSINVKKDEPIFLEILQFGKGRVSWIRKTLGSVDEALNEYANVES